MAMRARNTRFRDERALSPVSGRAAPTVQKKTRVSWPRNGVAKSGARSIATQILDPFTVETRLSGYRTHVRGLNRTFS